LQKYTVAGIMINLNNKTSQSLNLKILISSLLFSLAVSIIVFGSASLPGNDVFYHIRMAEIISSGNWAMTDFPWTTCSIWSHPFFNKEWLFHIYLIPFILIFGNIAGAKVATAVTAFLIALAWGNLFKTLKVKNLIFAMLFMLFCTGYIYIGRLVLCRSFLISILFMPLALNCVFRRKRVLLVFILYLYMLAYVGAWQMLPVIFIFDLFIFLEAYKKRALSRTEDSKVLLKQLKDLMIPWAFAGVVAGILITPYFPINIKAIYTQTILILKAQWFGVNEAGTLPMGTELAPIPLKHLICYIGIFSLFGFTLYDLFHRTLSKKRYSSAIPSLNKAEKSDSDLNKSNQFQPDEATPRIHALILLTTIYLTLTLFTQKFVEYLVPLLTLTIFLYWEKYPLPAWNSTCPFYTPKGKDDYTLSTLRRKFVIALLILAGIVSIFQIKESFYRKNLTYQDSSEWIKKNIPKGTLIFSGDWDDNVILFYYLTDYKFLVLLDPYFMYAESPKKFILWEKIVSGKVEDAAGAIEEKFNTNVVFVPPDRQRLRHRLLMNDRSKLLYEGKSGESIFLLKP
jgi:hypothetical protein